MKNNVYIDSMDLLQFEKKKEKEKYICHGFIAFWEQNI